MQKADLFDRVHMLLLLIVMLFLTLLFLAGRGNSSGTPAIGRNMERELAAQARLAFLQKLYDPVEELAARGELQAALLKLDELGRLYPGEAHGRMLQGRVMLRLGAVDQAFASYAAGVRLNGEYLDKRSPLSRRAEISRLVEEGGRDLLSRANDRRWNTGLQQTLREMHYLESRLAGGCE